jgi:UDP-N-acetylmuramoyl-tripeptide--D-alanyl-D-alanine ligase
MDLSLLYNLYLQHPLVCTDTRKIEKNCIFFALKGENFNGNTFAENALELGAAYVVIDEEAFKISEKCILVQNVLNTLQDLATWHRKQLNIPVIAIVGSNGKTTSKELIAAVLQQKFKVLSTPGNFNNHIGLPLTLLMLNQDHEIAVIEMGANHEKENALLCQIALPSHGLVTNNGKDHLEGFGDLAGVIRSNAELYDYLQITGGLAFVNSNDATLMQKSENIASRITYAATTNTLANYAAETFQLQPQISFSCKGHNYQSSLSGDYNLDNIMAALAIGFHFGLNPSEVAAGIASYAPKNLRSEILVTTHNKIFLDAYNANPSSMEVSIRNFSAMPGENKLYVLGDMFEMGAYEAQEHQALAAYCVAHNLENVWLVGKAFSKVESNFRKFETTAEVIAHLKENPLQQHFVFLKGSRGMKLETLVEYL